MMRKLFSGSKCAFLLAVALLVTGCAGTTRMVVNPTRTTPAFDTAYIVTHGGKSSDMDGAFMSALVKEGLNVQTGPNEPNSPTNAYVLKYNDDWNWDFGMFLESVSVSVYNGQTNSLLAHASWKNSFFHSFPDINEVADNLVHGMFTKLNHSHDASVHR